MSITRVKASSITQGLPKGKTALTGNEVSLPGSFESIATITASGSSSSFTFGSIPSGYKHLQIRAFLKATGPSGAATYGGWTRINGDTGSNYSYHGMYPEQSGSTTAAYGSANTTTLNGISYTTADATSIFGSTIIDILDYTDTNKYKTVRMFGGADINATAYALNYASGVWRSTAAITSFTLEINTGFGAYYLTSDSKAYLYGIK